MDRLSFINNYTYIMLSLFLEHRNFLMQDFFTFVEI